MNTFMAIFFNISFFVLACAIFYAASRGKVQERARIKGETQQRKQAVIERRTETERVIQTEKVIIELVPNEELSQHLSNLTGSIDHHAQVIETTAQIMPLSLEIPRNQIEKPVESEVSQSVPNSVPPALNQVFQGVPPEQVVQAYLDEHGSASIREIGRETGLSQGTISRTNAWKNRPK